MYLMIHKIKCALSGKLLLAEIRMALVQLADLQTSWREHVRHYTWRDDAQFPSR